MEKDLPPNFFSGPTQGFRSLQDPVHGQITLQQIFWDIIDTPQFKRLQHLKQLGLCY
jgi:hypothetical protein